MWEKIKLKMGIFWTAIKPELWAFIKIVVKLGIDILLPLAMEAVSQAALQKDMSGNDKFNFAVDYVKAQAPNAAATAAVNAVRIAYSNKTGEVSKY